MPEPFHPDLRLPRLLPRSVARRRWVPAMNAALRGLLAVVPRSSATEVAIATGVVAYLYRAEGTGERRPAVLWIHGGGLIMGDARQDERFCRRLADQLGAVVLSVQYRLAPTHRYPTAVEDCLAALKHLAERSDVDPARIAVAGASAGGGLAAATCLLARERGEVTPAFQLLVYPMLDDRSGQSPHPFEDGFRLWNSAANRFGWSAYLGARADDEVPPTAAPARNDDFTDLPPAWIGVGTLDLFLDEDRAYAARLRDAGVRCTTEVVAGAYHGFDVVEPRAPVSRAFRAAQIAALASALHD